jgi:hypothetical protein
MSPNQSSGDDWPFDQPRNVAVMTTRQVLEQKQPIVFVSRDLDDGAWQFHSAGAPSIADAMIVALEEMVEHDPTLRDLADPQVGWTATREEPDCEWIRYRPADV